MSKPLSVRQLAMAVTNKVVADIKQYIKDPEERTYQKDALRLHLDSWIEQVSNVPLIRIDKAISDGDLIEIKTMIDEHSFTRLYLPGDLRIVKEFHRTASSAALTDMHDRRCTQVPFDKLFTPSMFPKLDYADVRERELVLGDNGRVAIKDSGREHYRLYDEIKRANFEAQKQDYDVYVESKNARGRLWRRHPDCMTTDDLMKELGVWNP